MAVTVDIYMDMSVYLETLSDKFAQGINTRVRRFAKEFVAHPSAEHPYSTGHLRDNIMTDSSGIGEYETYVDLASVPYAAAQEWGRPDLPNYTFTPYMRPAAEKASTKGVQSEVFEEAKDAAERAAKI